MKYPDYDPETIAKVGRQLMSMQDVSVICAHGTSSRRDVLTGALVHYDGVICDKGAVSLGEAVNQSIVTVLEQHGAQWNPTADHDGTVTLGEAVGQALGSASMCWVGGTGSLEFDSVQAERVYDGLMAYLSDWADAERARYNEKQSRRPMASFSTREMIVELKRRAEDWPPRHKTEQNVFQMDMDLYLKHVTPALLDDRG